MDEHNFLSDILIFLVAAVIVVPVFQRLRSSMILGYLCAGLIIGPFGLGLVQNEDVTRGLGELGVIFLLFTIGLELTVDRLKVIRGFIFGLGSAQVLLTGLAIFSLALVLCVPLEAAIVIGASLALSSTAVVMQLLTERGETMTRSGRVSFSILLLQDLAVVPLFAIVPALAIGGGGTGMAALYALGKAVIAIIVIFAFGRLVLRPVFRIIAIGRSPELFAGITLLVLLGTAFGTDYAGLSMAMGGFIAGMLLGETEYRIQVAAEIAPFKGLLLGLFFMTVGLDINLGLIANQLALVLSLAVGLLVLKAGLLICLVRLSKQEWPIALQTGLTLAQGGEFAFIILGLATQDRIVAPELADLLITVVALTMVVTPGLAWAGRRLGQSPPDKTGAARPEESEDASHLQDHVIVLGFGRVGQSVSKMLLAGDIPHIAVEYEPSRVSQARERGLPVYYGNAGHPETLEALGAGRARAVVVTLDNPEAAERAVHLIHQRYPRLDIFVRARDFDHQRNLENAGASAIIPETFEMSLQLGASLLRRFGTGSDAVEGIVNDLRVDQYAALNDIIHTRKDSDSGDK